MNPDKRPAILGGKRSVVSSGTVDRPFPSFGATEENLVLDVLRSGNLSGHSYVHKLEAAYTEYTGARYALAHCNGTAALLASFFALGIGPGDEVIVPSATFWASVVPLLWLGAIPVFAESEAITLGLDPLDVEKKITGRTKAIVAVHLFGIPSKMDELRQIAFKHKLKVVEDASHAHGAEYKNKKCGNLGDVAVFSLQTSKLAPAGEGGILLTNDEAILNKAISLGDMSRLLELSGPEKRFGGTTFGIKTRIASLSAAVGLAQIRSLDERNVLRNKNIAYINDRIEPLGFDVFRGLKETHRVFFEFVIRRGDESLLSTEQWVNSLNAEGCNVSLPRYPLLHRQPLFTEGVYRDFPALKAFDTSSLPVYLPDSLPSTQDLNMELIKLPLFLNCNRPVLDEYVEAFHKINRHEEEIYNSLMESVEMVQHV